MPASIQTTLLDSPSGSPVAGAPVLAGASRDDLRKGYQVELDSVDVHTTYEWSLDFVPDSPDLTASAATVTLTATGVFTIADSTQVVDGDTVDIGGINLTARAAAPGFDEFLIVSGDDATTATNAAAAINNGGSSFVGVVTANAPGAGVVDVSAASTGAAGNLLALGIALTNAGSITISGAFLEGGSDLSSKVALFNVDHEGPYLVKLIVDKTLGTEDTQYVRLRFVTRFGDLTLVAGGERRDSGGVVPIDVDPSGWSQEQNTNVQRLAALVRRTATTGRALYVDSNRGRDAANTPNDTTLVIDFPGPDATDLATSGIQSVPEGFGDFYGVQAAIDYAMAYAGRGEPAPSATNPYTIYVQPGLYVEDVTFEAYVHVVGLAPPPQGRTSVPESNYVTLRTANTGGTGTHIFAGTGATVFCQLETLTLENTDSVTTEPMFKHSGGVLEVLDCVFRQKGVGATQGPAYHLEAPATVATLIASQASFLSDAAADDDRYAMIIDGTGSIVELSAVHVEGRSGVLLNPTLYGSVTFTLEGHTDITAGAGYALRGCAEAVTLNNSVLTATTAAKVIVLDGESAGTGAFTGDFSLAIARSWVQGYVIYDEDIATGTTQVLLDLVQFDDPGDASLIQFPSGNPDSFVTNAGAQSIYYTNDYTDPMTAAQAVVLADRLVATNVQNALDELATRSNGVLTAVSVAAGPTYTVLSTDAYVGVDSATPATTIGIILPNSTASGAVDGRQVIIKDEGGGAGVGGQEINVYGSGATSTIDGVVRAVGTPWVLNLNYTSITLICRGATGTTATWFIV